MIYFIIVRLLFKCNNLGRKQNTHILTTPSIFLYISAMTDMSCGAAMKIRLLWIWNGFYNIQWYQMKYFNVYVYWKQRYMHVFTTSSMMTSSNGNIFRVTGHMCGEFTGPRWVPRTKANDAELWCFRWSASEKWLSKLTWCWWFETLFHPLWRQCNVERMSLPHKPHMLSPSLIHRHVVCSRRPK